MSGDPASRAAELLIGEAWDAYLEGRLPRARDAAQRGVEAAELAADLAVLVRALRVEGSVLHYSGDHAAALVRYTRVLALAGEQASAGRLNDSRAMWAVADTYVSWVETARMLSAIPVRDLFGVLDAGEQWLTATGHWDWRSDLMLARALVHQSLEESGAAVSLAREALALKIQHPETPSFRLASYRSNLADMLCEAGLGAEAQPHYQAILDDPDSALPFQRIARTGLARCALAAGDMATALAEARAAVALAESLGDIALCNGLHVLARACRLSGDLDGAWREATRYLEVAGRTGSHYRQFYATRLAVDIALDRCDLAAARPLLAGLEVHAAAMDASTGLRIHADETAARQRRAAEVAGKPAPA